MPYAQGRTFFDADSHVMELPDFLRDHADPGDRDKLPELSFASGGKMRVALEELKSRQGHAPEHVEELVELGDGLIAGPKGYEALGAFNPAERSQALQGLMYTWDRFARDCLDLYGRLRAERDGPRAAA